MNFLQFNKFKQLLQATFSVLQLFNLRFEIKVLGEFGFTLNFSLCIKVDSKNKAKYTNNKRQYASCFGRFYVCMNPCCCCLFSNRI
ncbi:DNA repair protein RecO C-terminal domain-containing protein [Pseudoalteromonas sp. Scap03]|uniref:DNA repair protein RecO C-terminal domain-containing protein n=1 Tax=unclassified Pseudoalteromonas TaxID=194690 RepID=UPI003557A729